MRTLFDEIYKKRIPENISIMNKDKFRRDEDMDDYVQEMYCIFLEIDENKVADLQKQGKLEDYFAKICFNQLLNRKSKYNRLMENNIIKEEYKEGGYDDERDT